MESETIVNQTDIVGLDSLLTDIGDQEVFPFPVKLLLTSDHSDPQVLETLKALPIQSKTTTDWTIIDFCEYIFDKLLKNHTFDYPVHKYIFLDILSLPSTLQDFLRHDWRNGNIPNDSERLLVPYFGTFWESFWGISRDSFQQVSFRHASIPKEADTVVLQKFIQSQLGLSQDDQPYIWTHSNPFIQWSCILQNLVSKSQSLPLQTRNNLEKVGVSSDLVDQLLEGETPIVNILQNSTLLRSIFNHYVTQPVSTQDNVTDWYSANPYAPYSEERGQAVQISSSRGNSFRQTHSWLNRLFLVSEKSDVGLSDEVKSAYFPQSKVSYIEPWWNQNNDNSYIFYQSLKSIKNPTEMSLGEGTILINVHNLLDATVGQSVNLIKVFNMFPLSPLFPLSSLRSGRTGGPQNGVKIYSPTVLMTQQPWDNVPSHTVLQWYQQLISYRVWYDNKPVKIQDATSVSVMVRLQAYRSSRETEEAEVLHLHGDNATLRFVEDQTVHTDVPLIDIVTSSTNYNSIKKGDLITVYRFDFCYGLLQINSVGHLRLYTQVYSGASLPRAKQIALTRINEFLEMIKSIGYLVNSTQSLPVNIPTRYHNKGILDYCPISSTSQYTIVHNLKSKIASTRFYKLISLFHPTVNIVQPDFVVGATLEALIDGEDWVKCKIIHLEYSQDIALVEVAESEHQVKISTGLRFQEERRSGKIYKFLFSLSGKGQQLTDLTSLSGISKQWGFTQDTVVTWISNHFHFPRRDAEKVYSKVRGQIFPANCCLVTLNVNKKMMCDMTFTPSLYNTNTESITNAYTFTKFLFETYHNTRVETQPLEEWQRHIQAELGKDDNSPLISVESELDDPSVVSSTSKSPEVSDEGESLIQGIIDDFQAEGQKQGLLSSDDEDDDIFEVDEFLDDENTLDSDIEDDLDEGGEMILPELEKRRKLISCRQR